MWVATGLVQGEGQGMRKEAVTDVATMQQSSGRNCEAVRSPGSAGCKHVCWQWLQSRATPPPSSKGKACSSSMLCLPRPVPPTFPRQEIPRPVPSPLIMQPSP